MSDLETIKFLLIVQLLPLGCAMDRKVVMVEGESLGSGVVVARGIVLTSAHLVGEMGPVVSRQDSSSKILRCRAEVEAASVARHEEVVALRVAPGLAVEGMVIGPPMRPGDPILIYDGTCWPPAVVRAEAVSSDAVRPTSRLDRIKAGLSGAPCVDKKGFLVGIVFGLILAPEGTLVAVSEVQRWAR